MTDEELNRIITKRFGKQDKRIDKLINTYSARLLKNYEDTKKKVKKELDYTNWRYQGNKDLVQYQALKNKLNRINEIINKLNKQSTSILGEGLSYAYKDIYYNTGFILESSTGINLSFSLINENVVRHALLNPLKKIRYTTLLKKWSVGLKDEVSDSFRAEIAKGITSGQSIDKIANQLVNSVSERVDVAFSRAQSIARTEVHRVTSIARGDAFKITKKAASNLNMKVKRMWLATADTRTRDTHQELDGEYYNEENGGYYLASENRYIKAPGQSNLAADVVNCRCTEIIEVEGYELKSRLDNESKEVIEYQNYSDWYANRKAS